MNMRNLFNSSWKGKAAMMIIAFLLLTVGGRANTVSDYYYSATATADVAAGGKVYVTDVQTNSPVYTSTTYTMPTHSVEYLSNSEAEVTLYFYAANNAGYSFKGWYDGNTFLSNSPSYTASQLKVSSTKKNQPTTFNYTAKFEELEATVFALSTDLSRGNVSVTPENNYDGVSVELKAIPDASKGVKFLGWRTYADASENDPYVSKDNPYTVTATATATTYYAYFSEPASMVYCILKNSDTGRYLSLYGDGEADPHTRTYDSKPVKDGFIFTNGLKMITEGKALANPMVVFKRVSTQETSTIDEGDLSTDVVMTDESGNQTAISVTALLRGANYPITFERRPDGKYRIYINVEVGSGDNTLHLDSYLCDSGSDFASFETIAGKNNVSGVDWYVYFLTEEQVEGSFGANAKEKYTQDDKYYYTSMYAPFAYKLLDGVKAYYLPLSEENYNETTNTISFSEISTGSIVPANTPVIIECTNTDGPTANRLLPVHLEDNSSAATVVGNVLKGYTQVFSSKDKKVNTVENSNLKYVFSILNNKLGFYHYNGQNMNPNKAYLELPVPLNELSEYVQNQANNAKFVFGSFEDPTRIELSNAVADDADGPIFDLQGRKIKNPTQGIYVRKGKKFVVK